MGIFSKRDLVETTASGIRVENVRNERPSFERNYTAKLERNNVTIEVRIRTFLGRQGDGMLTQPGGRWVSFDPKTVAEKILDSILAEQVQSVCDEIFALDKAYMRSDPKEFTDDGGHIWRRD